MKARWKKRREDPRRARGRGRAAAVKATGICWLSSTLLLPAAPVDESKLPPAATNRIDFVRDIKPILQTSCLRCHGPEKTKSGLRLVNSKPR